MNKKEAFKTEAKNLINRFLKNELEGNQLEGYMGELALAYISGKSMVYTLEEDK